MSEMIFRFPLCYKCFCDSIDIKGVQLIRLARKRTNCTKCGKEGWYNLIDFRLYGASDICDCKLPAGWVNAQSFK